MTETTTETPPEDAETARELISLTDLAADVAANASAALMVAGANGQAARVAPCLVSTDPAPSDAQLAEAKLILLGAITRWTEQGAAGTQQQAAGPYIVGFTTAAPGYRLWPSEITQLQQICTGTGERTVGSIDTAPGSWKRDHAPSCDFFFGGSQCSCWRVA